MNTFLDTKISFERQFPSERSPCAASEVFSEGKRTAGDRGERTLFDVRERERINYKAQQTSP
jgi:hypothetical protein